MENTSVTPISPRQVKVNSGHYKWNLAQPDFDSVVNNPITSSGEGLVFTAVAVLSRTDPGFEGHTYYLEEEHTPHGWDSQDCELVPQTPMPAPYTPPTGALPVPVNTSDLVLDVEVDAYGSKSEALKGENPIAILAPGDYLVFRKADNGMIHIGESRESIKYWINPADNQLPVPEEPEPLPSNFVSPRESSVEPEPIEEPEIVEPEPEPDFSWKDSYVAFPEPRIYVVNQEGRAWNEDETQPNASVMLYFDQHINVYGWFMREGKKYYRLKVKRDVNFEWWVAVPQIFNGRAVLTLPAPSWLDRLFHRHQQMKSIFSINLKGDMKLIDNVKNPYKTKENIK